MENKITNKEFWNKTAGQYSKTWETYAKQRLSKKELLFIGEYLADKVNILDIGIGNGRILDFLSENTNPSANITGVDIAENMVEYCKNKFSSNTKIKDIYVCDLSEEEIKSDEMYDLVTIIRVLKYNSNWKEMIKRIHNNMTSGGTLILEMPNRFSINKLAPLEFKRHYSAPKELREFLGRVGFKNIVITGFTKLPDFLYDLTDNRTYGKVLLSAENLLSSILGDKLLTRFFFVKCDKK